MTPLDVLLRRWRLRTALKHIAEGSRVLDIGTYDGALFNSRGLTGVGIDPELAEGVPVSADVTLVQGTFPADLPRSADPFDIATALAVVEHVPEGGLFVWAERLATLVRADGLVVITVPAPAVDSILHVLMRLKLIAGMEAHQHHGFRPDDLLTIFVAPAWRLVRRSRFQLGLNNLFIFQRVRGNGPQARPVTVAGQTELAGHKRAGCT